MNDGLTIANARIRRLERRIKLLYGRTANITGKLVEDNEKLRVANNRNVEIINIGTANDARLQGAALDILRRLQKVEAFQADSIFGSGDNLPGDPDP